MPDHRILRKDSISLAFMVEQLRSRVGIEIEPVGTTPLESRRVVERNLHRPGLILAGYDALFQFQRIQVLGNTECRYLNHFPPGERETVFQRLITFDVPCLILTAGNTLEPALVALADARSIPVLRTDAATTQFMWKLSDFLEDQFAPQTTVHGSLVDVYGVGLLLMGKSGIGKSEIALDLVERGHRLVADDVVVVTGKQEGILMGAGTELVQHFMEIRGLGLIDVRSMFGIRAIRFQKRVEVVIHMQVWDEMEEYTRLGMVDESYTLMDVELPLVKLPITPGKNVTVICEVIAMNYLLRHYGYDPAEVFAKRLADHIRQKDIGAIPDIPRRATEYFENDTE
ncbi:MAG TPA: HPr(Ser) kinase/phosphatase [Rhodothermales bacterium]|nr:HPr(Ser) kinase/phosphatase [Rhodothermales bacterium]